MKSFKTFVTEISKFKRDEIAFELRHEDPHGYRKTQRYSRPSLHAIHYLKNTGKDPSNPEHEKHMRDTYGAEHSEKAGWHIKDHGYSTTHVSRAHKDFGSHNVKKWIPKN